MPASSTLLVSVELVLDAGVEVVRAVRGRGVHHAGAGVHGDVVGEHAENCAIEERVCKVQRTPFCCRGSAPAPSRLAARTFAITSAASLLGDDVDLAGGFKRDVLFVGMKGHRHRRGKRPGSGGPDDGETFFPASAGSICRRIVGQRVLYPDGRAGVVFVFDFGFGQGSLVVDAPVDGAQALVDEVLFVKTVEGLQHHRLVLRSHGGVGMVPTSEDADAFELLALQIEKFLRVLSARFAAHLELLHLEFFAAELSDQP